MKILNLCAADYGGAGIAAMRIHTNLRSAGVDSRMLVLDKRTNDSWTEPLLDSRNPFRLWRIFHKIFLKVSSLSDYYFQRQNLSPELPLKVLRKKIDFEPDVIVAHVLSHFLSPRDVLKIHKITNAPVIWNLMDMAAFTGGCHYAWSCRRYEERCGDCPALRLRSDGDVSRKVWQEKSDVMSAMNMAVIAASSLLHEQATRSNLFRGSRIETILLAVDPETFHQRDRCEAKRILGLSDNKRVIFFGAQKLKNRRKGMDYMLEALSRLADIPAIDCNSIQIVTAGNISELGALERMRYSHKHLGYIHGDAQLALVYQAADVFVCPSIQDSGPMMINESMMCGTPVVAFKMGVASDLIIPGVTGYIAKLMDACDLAAGIASVTSLNEEKSAEMSDRCREHALALCHPLNQAKKLIQFFSSISKRDDIKTAVDEESRVN